MPEGTEAPPTNEHDLLQRARRLDESALGAIFDAFYEPLYRYIHRHLGHDATAEDLTAEVFRRFLEQIAAGNGPTSNLKAWLYRVAHNLMVDELRRGKHRRHEPLDEDLPASEPPVGEQAIQAAMKRDLQHALLQLSPKQQAVLTLKFQQGLENEEIARALGMNTGTVRALQQRGLRTLQRLLQANGVLEEDE